MGDDSRLEEAKRFQRDAPRGCMLVVKGWVLFAFVGPAVFIAIFGGAI